MAAGKKDKSPVESFGDMVKEFGEAVSEIFNDPALKKKAKEFAKSAEDSAKTFGRRFKDEKVKDRFNDFKEAAHDFGIA
jgi:[ribosomal protein S5]-alanine N-acetyltransferase